jgi:hypothetical protein
MAVATVLTIVVTALILFAVVAPSLASWKGASSRQGGFATEYDRVIAEFARHRRVESKFARNELSTGKFAGRAVTDAPRLDHSRSRVGHPSALRRRSS